MTNQEYEYLSDLLADLEVRGGELKGREFSFVHEMIERHAKWGKRMLVSVDQRKWLEQIAQRLGI